MNPHTYGYARGMSHAYAQVEQFLQEELNRLHELGSNGLLDDYIVEIADKMGLYIVRPREQENA